MAASVVQTRVNSDFSGNGTTFAPSASLTSVAAGDAIVVFFTHDYSNGAPTMTCADSAGNTYTAALDIILSTGDTQKMTTFVAVNCAAGSNVLPTVTGTGPSMFGRGIVVVQVTGVVATALGANEHKGQNQTAPAATPTTDGASTTNMTPTGAGNNLIVAHSFNAHGVNNAPNAGTGFTDLGATWAIGGNNKARTESKIVVGTSGVSGTFTALASESHLTSGVVFQESGSAAVVQPPVDGAPQLWRSSRVSGAILSSVSGASALLPLTPTAGVQFYPSDTPPPRRVVFIDRSAAASSAPIVPTATVTPAWWAQEQYQPRRKLSAEGAGFSVMVPPLVSTPPTWVSPEQYQPRRKLAPEGAGFSVALHPLASFPPMTWAVPSPILIRSPSAADGGGGAISPLLPPMWMPDVPAPPALRRPVTDDAGSATGLRALSTVVVQPPPDAPMPARRRVSLDEGSGFGERALYLANLSWFQAEAAPAPRRAQAEDRSAQLVSPLNPSGTPGWMAQPADRVIRRAIPVGEAVLVQPQSTAVLDMSWAAPVAERPAARRPVLWADAPYPAALNAPALSPWGWIPEQPARPAPRIVRSETFNARMDPLVSQLQPLSWLPDYAPPRPPRPVVSGAEALVRPMFLVKSGWESSEVTQPILRRPTFEAPASVPLILVGGLAWVAESPQPARSRLVVHASADLALRPMQMPPVDWASAAEPARPRRPVVQAASDSVLRPLVTMGPFWEPEPPRVVRRARLLTDDPQPPLGVLVRPALGLFLPSDPGRPAARVVVYRDFSVMPGGQIVPPAPVVLRLFSMVGAVAADVVRVYFGDGTDTDA